MISPATGGVRLDVRVIPRSSRSAVDGTRNGRLLVRVTAPPVDAAANRAVIAFLSETLDVPRKAVQIISGDRSRDKSLLIADISIEEVRRRLDIILAD